AVRFDLDDPARDVALRGAAPEDEPEELGSDHERRPAEEARRRGRSEPAHDARRRRAARSAPRGHRGSVQDAVAMPTCMRKPMSPWTFILPVMNASWAFIRFSWIATWSASAIVISVRGVVAPLKVISSLNGSPDGRVRFSAIVPRSARTAPLDAPCRFCAGTTSAGTAPFRELIASSRSGAES